MSKLLTKFLANYSFSTLRDVVVSNIENNDFIVFNSVTQKFENTKQSRFGVDFKEQTKSTPDGQTFTGNSFQVYDTTIFNVSGPDTLNKFRLNIDFIADHNSASNDIRARMILDNQQVGEEFRIEPKDPNNDQRPAYFLKWYAKDLSIGQHTLQLFIRPATASRVSRVYQSITEIWRVE